MKKKYNIISAVLIVIILTTSAIFYYRSDREGPLIEFPQNEITYTQGEGYSELLNGVKAIDSRDGDVSSTLIVENVVPLSNGSSARVTYAAQDKDGHITKKSLIINYIATENEKNASKQNNQSKQKKDTTSDDNAKIKDTQNSLAGITPTLSPKEIKAKEKPVIKLNTKEITLMKGSLFEPLKIVKEVKDNKDERNDIYTRIHIDGYYSMKIPGTYIIEYYVIDSDNNVSSPAYLKLIVTE